MGLDEHIDADIDTDGTKRGRDIEALRLFTDTTYDLSGTKPRMMIR